MCTNHQTQSNMIRKTFPVGPLACNCSIIGDPVTKRAIVIDPGGDADKILETLKALGLKLTALIHTHAHLDHFLASGILKEKTGVPIFLHQEDLFLWQAVGMQCQMLGIPPVTIPGPDSWLKDDLLLSVCDGVTLHTPGHTPGSSSFWFAQQKVLIAGDTLFRRSIGRTDLPGGDFKAIEQSIRQRLYVLEDDVLVITGHGPETTIGAEKAHNLFVADK